GRDGSEEGGGGADVGALLELGEARQPGERRDDRGVREIQLRLAHRTLGGQHCRSGGLLVSHGIVEILLRHRVLLRERLHAREVRFAYLQAGLLLGQLAAGLLQRRLERLLIHDEERLARLDQITLRVGALFQEAVDAGADLHFPGALRLADELVYDRRVPRLDGQYCNVGRLRRRGRRLFRAAGGKQHAREQRGEYQTTGKYLHEAASHGCSPSLCSRSVPRPRCIRGLPQLGIILAVFLPLKRIEPKDNIGRLRTQVSASRILRAGGALLLGAYWPPAPGARAWPAGRASQPPPKARYTLTRCTSCSACTRSSVVRAA